MTDSLARIERLKRERAKLTTPIERIAFDNDPANGSFAERIVALTEADKPCPHGSYRFVAGADLLAECRGCGKQFPVEISGSPRFDTLTSR